MVVFRHTSFLIEWIDCRVDGHKFVVMQGDFVCAFFVIFDARLRTFL